MVHSDLSDSSVVGHNIHTRRHYHSPFKSPAGTQRVLSFLKIHFYSQRYASSPLDLASFPVVQRGKLFFFRELILYYSVAD